MFRKDDVMHHLFRTCTFALSALVALASWAGPPPSAPRAAHFDEVFDVDGRIRPHYQGAYFVYSRMTPRDRERMLKQAKREFRGDNALDPLPRLITEEDYEILRRGVEQRGTALRMFLQDYYGGNDRIYKIIPKNVLDEIVARAGESDFRGIIKPEHIAFPYGPDIVRDATGRWRVIEDNPGFIGGPGDLLQARDSLFKNQPGYKGVLKPKYEPEEFYRTIMERAKARANGGKVVIYQVPPYPDKEDNRLRKIYQDLGAEVVTPNTKQRLIVKEDGVFLRRSPGSKKLERVGYVMINGEHKWVDATFPVTREQYMIYEARAHLAESKLGRKARVAIASALWPNTLTGKVDFYRLERALKKSNFLNEFPIVMRNSVEGLMEAVLTGKVATNYAPGLDFIGDKAFYTYVDDLVRFYLGTEPLVPNLPTYRFMKYGTKDLDPAVMDRIFKDDSFRNYVIKIVDGRGGDGVYIGPKLKASEIPELIQKIREAPASYIAQPFTPLSQIEDRIVDMRLISDVGPKDIFVSRTPWGRGVPISGDGKVNLSKHGREFAVMVVPDERSLPESKGKCVQLWLYEGNLSW